MFEARGILECVLAGIRPLDCVSALSLDEFRLTIVCPNQAMTDLWRLFGVCGNSLNGNWVSVMEKGIMVMGCCELRICKDIFGL